MDPLAQLKDVHLPAQITQYPIAPGWWILAFSFLILTAWAIRRFLKQRQFNRPKRIILKRLQFNNYSNAELITMLKFTLSHYYQRDVIASLFGDKLEAFLTTQLPIEHQQKFAELANGQFATHYQADTAPSDSLNMAVNFWLKQVNLKQVTNAQGMTQDV